MIKAFLQRKPMATLTNMQRGTVEFMGVPHAAYKEVKCVSPIFGETTCIAHGYVPKGATVVCPPIEEDNGYGGHSRLTSDFIVTSIDGQFPFSKCYGELQNKSGINTMYKKNSHIRVRPHTSFDTRDASGIHVVDIPIFKGK
jgi:hypothetical protein